MDSMASDEWELGAAFLPASVSYLLGTNLFGSLGHYMGRWRAAQIGLVVIGLYLILVPFTTEPHHLIIPMAGIGFAIGMVDSSIMPELGNLEDLRHSSVYGGVYAFGDIAFCVGFAVGPAVSGSLVRKLGFPMIVTGLGFICCAYSPFLSYLKYPPARTEKEKMEQQDMVCGEKTNYPYEILPSDKPKDGILLDTIRQDEEDQAPRKKPDDASQFSEYLQLRISEDEVQCEENF